MVYQLLSLAHRRRIRLKARVTEDAPQIASVTGIWKGAEFMEREVYDLMGITFVGHPDLRRILLPEDYEEGHPLRKDFPTEGHGSVSYTHLDVYKRQTYSKLFFANQFILS